MSSPHANLKQTRSNHPPLEGGSRKTSKRSLPCLTRGGVEFGGNLVANSTPPRIMKAKLTFGFILSTLPQGEGDWYEFVLTWCEGIIAKIKTKYSPSDAKDYDKFQSIAPLPDDRENLALNRELNCLNQIKAFFVRHHAPCFPSKK
jgi:hypothetical protein